MKKLILLIFISTSIIYSQKLTESEIIEKVQKQIENIDDFSANIVVKVNVEKIKVPQMDVQLYYKKPNKFHIKSKNFALVPKEALGFNILNHLKNYKSQGVQKIKTDSAKYYILNYEKKIYDESIPLKIKLIIDADKFVITEISTEQVELNRTAKINFVYNKFEEKYYLPTETNINFSFKAVEDASPKRNLGKNSKTPRSGAVNIFYKNYNINKGLPDSLFVENN